MITLTEDYEECATEQGRRWVARVRREHGIRPAEASCWFVDVEQNDGSDTKWLGSSPGDALSYARALASNAARQVGMGTWTLEVWGDGVNTPEMLRVWPRHDPAVEL